MYTVYSLQISRNAIVFCRVQFDLYPCCKDSLTVFLCAELISATGCRKAPCFNSKPC